MSVRIPETLTPEQETEARRIADVVTEAARADILAAARLLASKPDSRLLGETEFRLRDIVHGIAAKAVETALDGRKKGGIQGRA